MQEFISAALPQAVILDVLHGFIVVTPPDKSHSFLGVCLSIFLPRSIPYPSFTQLFHVETKRYQGKSKEFIQRLFHTTKKRTKWTME